MTAQNNDTADFSVVRNETRRFRIRNNWSDVTRNRVEDFSVGKVTSRQRIGRWIFVMRYVPVTSKSGKVSYRKQFSYRADGQTWQIVTEREFNAQWTKIFNKMQTKH